MSATSFGQSKGLQSEVRTPEALQRAGDWVLAAVVMVVREWRAVLVWAFVFGLPYSFFMLVTGVERVPPPDEPRMPFSVLFTGFLLFLVYEPWAGGAAYRYLKARADGETLTLGELVRFGASRLVPLAIFQVLLTVPVQAVGFLLTHFHGWLPFLLFWTLQHTAHAVFVMTPALIAVGGMNPLRAFGEALRNAASRFPVYIPAYCAAGVIKFALVSLATSPDVLAEAPTCIAGWAGNSLSCSLWWRLGYLWLKTAAAAPFYALAFIAYLEASSSVSTVEPANSRHVEYE